MKTWLGRMGNLVETLVQQELDMADPVIAAEAAVKAAREHRDAAVKHAELLVTATEARLQSVQALKAGRAETYEEGVRWSLAVHEASAAADNMDHLWQRFHAAEERRASAVMRFLRGAVTKPEGT
jgi:hypothetical protein